MLNRAQVQQVLSRAFLPVAAHLLVDEDGRMARLDLVAYEQLRPLASVHMELSLLCQPGVLRATVQYLRDLLTQDGARLSKWEPGGCDWL